MSITKLFALIYKLINLFIFKKIFFKSQWILLSNTINAHKTSWNTYLPPFKYMIHYLSLCFYSFLEDIKALNHIFQIIFISLKYIVGLYVTWYIYIHDILQYLLNILLNIVYLSNVPQKVAIPRRFETDISLDQMHSNSQCAQFPVYWILRLSVLLLQNWPKGPRDVENDHFA